jgi:hypothetical protein
MMARSDTRRMRRRLTLEEQALRAGRIRRVIATTKDWPRWFFVNLETCTLHVIPYPQTGASPSEKTAAR